jgi:hypothetical protein
MANAINASGTIVGISNNQAFSQTGSVFTTLPPVNGSTASETVSTTNP